MGAHRSRLVPTALFTALTAIALLVPAGLANASPREVVSSEVHVPAGGTVRVLAGLATPETQLPSAAEPHVRRAQDEVLRSLAGTRHRVNRRFRFNSSIALDVGSDALERLSRHPLVTHVQPDRKGGTGLAQSTNIVRATTAASYGLSGTGWTVAVIDTGVDPNHPFVSGAILHGLEGCFASDNACPNGQDTMTGPGASVPCNVASGCPHGTHVAGIAVGRMTQVDPYTTMSGVARGANLLPVNVFHAETCGTTTCGRFWASDLIAGIEHVVGVVLSTQTRIASVNMSIGGGAYATQAECDAANVDLKKSINHLRAVGIAPVAISGNDSNSGGMWGPACITGVISVGNTDKSDVVHSTSNSTSFLSLLAPGTSIRSSIPGGGYDSWDGTSMAGPHVAGAWAVLKQVYPDAPVNRILDALGWSGRYVTDTRNNVTRARIDVFAAYERLGVRILDAKVREDAGYARFAVVLPYAVPQTVGFYVWTVNGSATRSYDYQGVPSYIEFAPGETQKTINVPIVNDSVQESTESFSVVIQLTAGNFRVTRPQATGTIVDNDGYRSSTYASNSGTYQG